MRSRSTLLAVALVLVAAIVRIVGTRMQWFPANFSTVGAMALFAGATLRPRWLGLLVPVLVLLASDLILRHDPKWLIVYLPFALIALMAHFVKPRKSLARFAVGTVSASVLFFVISNFGVWVAWPQMYERSISGLWTCYVSAIPFFQNTLAGDTFFAAVLFSAFGLLETNLADNDNSNPAVSGL